MTGLRNEADKRARLIRAVGELLAEQGYEGLGLNRIALRSGVSKPMVYRYFGGLNGLLKAYIEQADVWLPSLAKLTAGSADGGRTKRLLHCFVAGAVPLFLQQQGNAKADLVADQRL